MTPCLRIKVSKTGGISTFVSAIITVKDLHKYYRIGHEKVKALCGVTLEIQKGEVCCILGTSGSGKSTLLNQLAGLEKPTKGAVFIGKTNVSKLSEDQLAQFRQKNIGFVFQSYNLLPALTAAENVSMPLLFRGIDRAVRDREAAAMLKKVGLGNRLHHKPSEMSGGQQQRVGIARAFVAKPKIVFADEPTGNLDSRTTLEVMRLLIDMAHEHNITFVLVTHDNELAKYADRIVTIKDGQLVGDRKCAPAAPSAALAADGENEPSTKRLSEPPDPSFQEQSPGETPAGTPAAAPLPEEQAASSTSDDKGENQP